MSTVFKSIREEVPSGFFTVPASFCRSVISMVGGRVELDKALEERAKQVPNFQVKTAVRAIGEEVLAGCDLSFRKGLEKLRLAAHNTRSYWYERRPGSLRFGFFPLRLDRLVSNLGVELTYQRGEGVVVALGGGVPTPDARLVEQAVRFAANADAKTLPLWAVLKSVFGIGATRAHQLARRFGLDPDRMRDGRVVNMGEGCYCNSCDAYHCAKCREVTAHSTGCGYCPKRCSVCGDPSENPCSGHPKEGE